MQDFNFVALDIGSGKLRMAELEFDDGNLECEHFAEVDYSGFYNGEFIDDDFESACRNAFLNVDPLEISTVFVNIPSEFCGQLVKNLSHSCRAPFDLSGKTRAEFLEFARLPENFQDVENVKLININLLNLSSDENLHNEYLNSADFDASVSYIYMDENIYARILDAIKNLGFSKVQFVCGANCQALEMTSRTMRKVGTVLIDCGYLTTTVALIKGDGIERLRSFSLGGGHLTADLAENLQTSFPIAEILKKKVILTADPSEVDYYLVNYGGKDYEFQASLVNKIVNYKIEQLSNMISKCLDADDFASQFLITGGALNNLKGAVDILSSKLGVVIKPDKLAWQNFDKPEWSALVALINYATKSLRVSQSDSFSWKNLWDKVKNWFDF